MFAQLYFVRDWDLNFRIELQKIPGAPRKNDHGHLLERWRHYDVTNHVTGLVGSYRWPSQFDDVIGNTPNTPKTASTEPFIIRNQNLKSEMKIKFKNMDPRLAQKKMLNWVLWCDFLANRDICVFLCFSLPFPPHKFIKVARKLLLAATFHFLQFVLGSCPVTFYSLCVNSLWGHKFHRMVYCLMALNSWQCRYTSVGTPLITPDYCATLSVCLDDGKQCLSCPIRYQFHIS